MTHYNPQDFEHLNDKQEKVYRKLNLKSVRAIYSITSENNGVEEVKKGRGLTKSTPAQTLKIIRDTIKENKVITMIELSKLSGFSLSTCQRNVGKLFKSGLIRKERDETAKGFPVVYIWAGKS